MTAKLIDDPNYRERVSVFRDRYQAGELLAEKLRKYVDKRSAILLAIPAGGVPVGYAVAKKLGIPIDLMIVRKIQIPWNTEAGFGAITWDDEIILNKSLLEQLDLTREEVSESMSKTKKIIQDRLRKFRGDKPQLDLRNKVVILVDDGLASGFTMLAAARSVKKKKPKKIVAAIPTASMGAIELIAPEVDEIVCLNLRSGPVFAVAEAYENWYDLTDEEVIKILKK